MSETKEAHDIIFSGLLEASHYLCKLGSNLSLRSTNCKNDKIIKTNLSNTDDINSAVDKLLLICELSKRSLENVENGVRKVVKNYKHRLKWESKVLRKIKEQGEKRQLKSKLNWYTFEFENLLLRISSKIHISQYTSAQISLKRLDQTIVNKYIKEYCKIYNKKLVQTTTSSSDAPKDEKDSECRLGNEKKHRQASSDNNERKSNMLKSKVDIVDDVKNNSSQNKHSVLKESKKQSNLLGTDERVRSKSKEKLKAKEVPDQDTSFNENIVEANSKNFHGIEDKTLKEIKATAKEDKVKKKNKKSPSEGPVSKDREIVKAKLKVENVVEDSKQKSSLEAKDDEETEKSLGKLSSTGGDENIRIKCVDINKLIDKAKELNCQIGFRTIKKKTSVDSKTEIKKNTKLPPVPSPPKESKIKFVAKPFDIKIMKMHNNLQILKKELNINKIVYRNKEIFNLIEDIDHSKGDEEPLKANSNKQKLVADDDPDKRRRHLDKNSKDAKKNNHIVNISQTSEDENKTNRANISQSSEDENQIKRKKLSEHSGDENEDNRANISEHSTDENNGSRENVTKNSEGDRAKVSDHSGDENNGNRENITKNSEDNNEGDRAKVSDRSGDENEGNKRKILSEHSINEIVHDGPKIFENPENVLESDNSSDFELRYSDSLCDIENIKSNETDIPEGDGPNIINGLAPKDPNGLNSDEFRNENYTEKGAPLVKNSSAKSMLLHHSDSENETMDDGGDTITHVKVSLLNDNSSGDETVMVTTTRAKRGLRLTSASPPIKRKKRSSSSRSSSENTRNLRSSSRSSSENTRKVKKMGRSSVKAGKNGSQGSETQDSDKDIDGLTNINSLHRSTKRGEPDSTSKTDKIKEKGKKKQTQKKNTNVVLDSDSNSSEGEQVEIDGTDFEGVPETLLLANGTDCIETFAKSDLLGECDSTNNEENSDKEETKMGDSSEDDNVKKKRRKLLAITSDSEADTTRKNDEDVKVSDFDDSEEENSEPAKRNKRKKKTIRSSDEASGASSNESSKKKRRRIKQVDDSDLSGSGSEAEGRRHGRKNIRKVMGKGQLEEATIKAAREERGRLARIAERQKLYNNLDFDESGKPDEVVLDKVVLDFDTETKEPLIQVDRGLVKKLKPHQANGIKFMWDACFESVKRIKKDKGSGCILAHCMGLGKTLQVISLTHTLLTHSELTGVRRVLVVCPLSTVLNWVSEINMWLEHSETDTEVDVYELSRYKQNVERAMQLKHWYEGGGICVLGYEMFRNLSAENSKKYRKKMLKSFQESLVDPGPDLVVCDEGHLLKNQKTSLSQSMNRIKTLRRIVLTGTPLQNNLKEYYCMVTFVKPNLLGKYNEYLNRFVNPITNGQYTDSTEHDIKIMKRRSHVLHKMLDGAVQRRDYGVLAPFLPPKHEYVVFITLSDIQITLYQHYLDKYSRRPLPGKSSGFLFPDFQSLQRIWTHPLVLKYNSERYEIMQQKKREREEEDDSEGSLIDFIDDESTPDESTSEDTSDLTDASDDSRKKAKKKKSAKKAKKESKVARRGTRANPGEVSDEVLVLPEEKYKNPTEWWIELVNEAELEDMRNSHKLVLLFDILRQCEAIGDKVLVFSQSLYSLDLIEHYLEKIDEATQEGRVDEKLGAHVGSWSPGVDYFRLDGSTSCENRSLWCKNFNREDNPRARLFLISTRAGGLGINLVAANRVVIFDVSWNPSHDVQSIFRVYRFGQKKPCYVYRFLAMGTMEEKIYERQVTKQAISKRVIDEQQIDRHYAENDLAELYKFEPRPPEPRPLPPLPKDRLFAEMLKDREQQIYKYHEHDSLLENKEEETLTEEERKAAWEDFENEKNRPPPPPFPNVWPMHNGMTANLMAQQQQQLAYAAVAAVLRKDVPNINDQQIREMVPLIYNANPALMQKMGDIYKYGMMNPGMMNSVMGGGAGGAAAGLGVSSSLQYEPPWQRQQQQQQQMRLQQLMQQQQQQLGQKYYAGGLGSRDPVAMALQQQFARELGDTARGRPRGRPPMQPRAPLMPDAAAVAAAAAAAADVVDLDSD